MSSATFEANPNSENEPWIERAALEGVQFRIWHLMFFCLCAFGILMVLFCCCVKLRVPRTKQEIEGDYKRKKIATMFRKRLKIISNQDMEAVDLRRALQIIIEADYREEVHEDEPAILDISTNENDTLVPSATNKLTFGMRVANVIRMGKFSMNNKKCNTIITNS